MGAVPSCCGKKKSKNCGPGFDGCKPCGNSPYKSWDSDDEFVNGFDGTTRSLGKFQNEEFIPGARIKVIQNLTSRNRNRMQLFPGAEGLVRQVHDDGHLLIRFENMQEKQWVSYSKVACLRVTGFEAHRENSSFLLSSCQPPPVWAAPPPEVVASTPAPNRAQRQCGAESAVPMSVSAAPPMFGMQATGASSAGAAGGSMRAPAVYAAAPGLGPANSPQASTPGQRTPPKAPAQQSVPRVASVMMPSNMSFAMVPGGRPGELMLTTGPLRQVADLSTNRVVTSDRFGRYREEGVSSNSSLKALDTRSNLGASNRSSSPPPSEYEANSNSMTSQLYPVAPKVTKLIQPGQAYPSLQPISPERAGNASRTWSEIDASQSKLQAWSVRDS